MKHLFWDKAAADFFKSAIDYIRDDSDQIAAKVEKEILETLDSLSENPKRFPPDKYKKLNNGSFRAFEINKFRISYLVDGDTIIVARVRHTSMAPKKY